MDEKITIIEGPPPSFETVGDGWALGLNEGGSLAEVALTRLRTFNGPALVERCHRAWSSQGAIHLEYRGSDGLESQAPIIAARTVDMEDGQLLLLWVRLDIDEVELQAEDDEDLGDDGSDDFDFPD
ncbi:MAG: hypothetical protein JXB15_11545 [Anaerolineales bacterium]|nr:hypothetical protein [Anaerolineales bacterium]